MHFQRATDGRTDTPPAASHALAAECDNKNYVKQDHTPVKSNIDK